MIREDDFDPVALAARGRAGLFGGVDPIAVRLIERCVEAGVAVPDRLAFVGADDAPPVCDMARVPLSSVVPGFREKGRAAAEVLATMLAGDPPPPRVTEIRAYRVTERASTRRLDTGHTTLDRLVLHFLTNAHRPVDIAVLCDACGVPKRTATHLIGKRYGLTPLELLDECRLRPGRRAGARGRGVARPRRFRLVSPADASNGQERPDLPLFVAGTGNPGARRTCP